MKRTDTQTLISAMRILARDVQSDDGIANAAIAEAADRLEELHKALVDIIKHQEASSGSIAKWTGAWNIAKRAIDVKVTG